MSTTNVAKAAPSKKAVSASETGHAKNIATFEELISFCTGYGTAYNPSKESLTLLKLKELQTKAKEALQQTKVAKTTLDNATNNRQSAFQDIKPFTTKLVNALAVSGATDLTTANAKTVNRKMQGVKSTSVLAPTPNADSSIVQAKSISTSQQSFDSKIDHFTKMVEIVAQEKTFAPNEVELQTKSLQEKLENMHATNKDVINTYTNWSNARIQRNETLYNPLAGLLQVAIEVKKYIKSIFGATSPQYKQVSGLPFSNLKK